MRVKRDPVLAFIILGFFAVFFCATLWLANSWHEQDNPRSAPAPPAPPEPERPPDFVPGRKHAAPAAPPSEPAFDRAAVVRGFEAFRDAVERRDGAAMLGLYDEVARSSYVGPLRLRVIMKDADEPPDWKGKSNDEVAALEMAKRAEQMAADWTGAKVTEAALRVVPTGAQRRARVRFRSAAGDFVVPMTEERGQWRVTTKNFDERTDPLYESER